MRFYELGESIVERVITNANKMIKLLFYIGILEYSLTYKDPAQPEFNGCGTRL